MSTGLAFSGGGISAAIGAACAWNTIVDVYNPSIGSMYTESLNLTISTVSGGSIGYGLWVNANKRIEFPKYRKNVTWEELVERNVPKSSTAKPPYFPRYGNNISGQMLRWCDSENDGMISVGEFTDKIHSLTFAKLFSWTEQKCDDGGKSHWWTSFIQRIFDIVCVDNILGGDVPWTSSFAFIDEKTLLPIRNPRRGALEPSSAERLHHVLSKMSFGSSYIVPFDHRPKPSSVLEALSYTSAFWAALLVTANTISYKLFGNLLLRANSSTCFNSTEKTASNEKLILDGGVIDTTGLVGLLQQQTENIIAFYNNNVPLSQITSPIAYLFGVDTATNSMNGLLGPSMSQVFPSVLYPEVIANLTNPKVGMAHLRGIHVLPNRIMGVEPYIIGSFIVFSNAKNDNFILEDEMTRSQLSPSWPDRYLFTPPRLDANVLCMFSDWKVRNYHEELDPILGR